MQAPANPFAAPTRRSLRLGWLCAILFFCPCFSVPSHAAATLLLEEPYSYDGAFSGTGHSAVYLNNVCAETPVVLRPCQPGESGVVLSRYNGIGGYDWIAIPLVSYLYAVDQPEAVPLFADAKLVAFLRDQYRRHHLKSLAPDRSDGSTPEGNWYELVGASYDRTIYGFEIETDSGQDALLIEKFNHEPNRQSYNFVKNNCADFVREVFNFYYPHALHRSVVVDLGVTTPKQIAKTAARYSRHHPELQPRSFVIPQVPGTLRRSKPIHGVVESVVAAKKYMLPLFLLHPYVAASLVAGYFGYERFDPAKNALILDASLELDTPVTRAERRSNQSRLEELTHGNLRDPLNEEKDWQRFRASAEPALDANGNPLVQTRTGDEVLQVGVSRGNILSTTGSPELAAGLLRARLHQELHPATARKTAPIDLESDLDLLQQLLSTPASGTPGTLAFTQSGLTSATPTQ